MSRRWPRPPACRARQLPPDYASCKKERVGDFKNAGREWHLAGPPEDVRVHDFVDPALGKAIPDGVYDILHDQGWVSVGMDPDTAEYAANRMRRWWREMGSRRFPRSRRLLITADGGGSNRARSRRWKVVLQKPADTFGLPLCHLPPGTSQWNKIEHRLFRFITHNWRGKPLLSHQTIVNLIGSTTTKTGLLVRAELDTNTYDTGIKVSDTERAQLKRVPLRRIGRHGGFGWPSLRTAARWRQSPRPTAGVAGASYRTHEADTRLP